MHAHLEKKIVQATVLAIVFVSAAIAVGNLVIGSRPINLVASIVITVFFTGLYYISKYKLSPKQITYIILISLYLIYCIMWFNVGGMYSSSSYWGKMILLAIIALSPANVRWQATGIFLATEIALTLLHWQTGDTLIAPLTPEGYQALPYISLVSSLGIAYLGNMLQQILGTEQAKTREQNHLLEEKNKIITAQNEEIRLINQLLEERVAERTRSLEEKQAEKERLLSDRESILTKLKKEEVFLRSVIDSLPTGILIFKREGTLYRWNQAVLNILQVDKVNEYFNVFDDKFTELYGLNQLYHRALAGEATLDHTLKLDFSIAENVETNKRDTAWLNISVIPLTDQQREVSFLVTSIEDITLRKNTRDALRTSEARLNAIINSNPDIIAFFDKDLSLVKWNEAYDRAVRKAHDVILAEGLKLTEFLPQKEMEQLWQPMFDIAAQGKPVSKTIPYEQAPGIIDYYEFSLYPVLENQQIIGYSQFTRDLTEQRISEIKRLENERQLRIILDHTPLILWSVDRNGKFTLSKGKGLKSLGLSEDQAVGKSIYQLYEDQPEQLQQLDFALKTGQGYFTSFEQNGAIFEAQIIPYSLQAGQIEGLIGVSFEVTEMKRTEEELHKSEAYLTSMLENISYAVWAIDPNFRITMINQTMKNYCMDTYGFIPQIGDLSTENLPEPHRTIWSEIYRTALTNKGAQFEYHLFGRFFEIFMSPIVIDGKTAGLAVFSKDVSKRKEAVNMLEKRRTFIDNVVQTVPGSVYLYHAEEQRFEHLNDRIYHILGYPVQGQIDLNDLACVKTLCAPGDFEALSAHFYTLVRNDPERKQEFVFRMKKADGSYASLLVHDTILARNVNMRVTLILGIVTDITSIREKERKLQEKEREVVEANQMMAEYKLMALRSVMNPHFLFNSLNSIQYYIAKNQREGALNYLSLFSKLIRRVLNSSVSGSILLNDEIEMLRNYVELEQMRFEQKFDFIFEIDKSIDRFQIEIPSLLIQPFLENAIIHGINNKPGRGTIKLLIRQRGNCLLCTVEDDGIGRAAAEQLQDKILKKHKPVGLMVTNERLEIINRKHSVSVEITDLYNQEEKPAGTRVAICIEL